MNGTIVDDLDVNSRPSYRGYRFPPEIISSAELVYQRKLDRLQAKLAEGEHDIDAGRYRELGQDDIGPFFQKVKDQALGKACCNQS